ncbi:MAG: VTT domain-containing protein [Parcubacteria group bacterium]
MNDVEQKSRKAPRVFLIVSLCIVVAYVVTYLAFPELDQGVRTLFSNLQEYALTNGLLGMFVFALAANATILLNIPYSAAAVLLAGLGLNPFLIALTAGVGAVVGELLGYLIGFGGSKLFAKSQAPRLNAVRQFLEGRKRATPLIIFTLAALPIPDDILIVPLGMVRYPFWKMVVPMTLGKIVQNAYFALLGRYSLGAINVTAEGNGFAIGLGTLLLLLGAIQLVLWIDWDAVLKRWTKIPN